MEEHFHDMEMTFPENDLNPVYVCACGVRTTSSEAARKLQGHSAREEEKRAMFSIRYGTPKSMAEIFAIRATPTRWERIVRWFRLMRVRP